MRPDKRMPRVALTRAEAAASLGVSLAHFKRHIQPELRVIRTGSARLIPVSELEAWADRNATRAGEAKLPSRQTTTQRPGTARTARGMAQGDVTSNEHQAA